MRKIKSMTTTIPGDLKYTKDHEWLRLEGSNAYIGITDFAQGELGDVVFIDITTLGKDLKQGEIFGTVEAVKTVSDLFMPVTGKVLEINPNIESNPESVNKDPYASGWMIKISVTNPLEVVQLLSAEEYQKEIGK